MSFVIPGLGIAKVGQWQVGVDVDVAVAFGNFALSGEANTTFEGLDEIVAEFAVEATAGLEFAGYLEAGFSLNGTAVTFVFGDRVYSGAFAMEAVSDLEFDGYLAAGEAHGAFALEAEADLWLYTVPQMSSRPSSVVTGDTISRVGCLDDSDTVGGIEDPGEVRVDPSDTKVLVP